MRTLLITSGKGGTGKTTVTAALVALASADWRVAVADCDVEASNLPLVLRTAVTHREPFDGTPAPVVDTDACLGCGACEDSCPFGALTIDDDVAVIDPWLCEGCGACERDCLAGAIEFAVEVAGEVVSGRHDAGPIVFGLLRPGQDLSGKLVTSVRERAVALAAAEDADLLLIDGPPGVGCPAIAAMNGVDGVLAVTEPTLSGEHDLRRLAELARRLRTPVAVVLNKADLSATGAARIRQACAALGLALLAELPYDDGLPAALEQVALGRAEPAALAARPALAGLHGVWAGLAPAVRRTAGVTTVGGQAWR